MLPDIDRFNVRVYGLLLRGQEILLAHEQIRDFAFTKFPGGGLEKGEGLQDGLYREFMEELETPLGGHELFYINDFFQRSAFRQEDQILAVYYLVSLLPDQQERLNYWLQAGKQERYPQHWLSFEWKSLKDIQTDDLTFPVDRKVLELLQKRVATF